MMAQAPDARVDKAAGPRRPQSRARRSAWPRWRPPRPTTGGAPRPSGPRPEATRRRRPRRRDRACRGGSRPRLGRAPACRPPVRADASGHSSPARSRCRRRKPRVSAGLAHLWRARRGDLAHLRANASDAHRRAGRRLRCNRPPELVSRLKRDYKLLRREAQGELFIQEPDALGGFGAAPRRRAAQRRHPALHRGPRGAARRCGTRHVPARGRPSARGRSAAAGAVSRTGSRRLCPNVTYRGDRAARGRCCCRLVYLMTVRPGLRVRVLDALVR